MLAADEQYLTVINEDGQQVKVQIVRSHDTLELQQGESLEVGAVVEEEVFGVFMC